ncbi:uncharacterized protein B0J16DRAFT_327401 [Fusarium flagelliforme]|uniref:uncharacterized protein n=1 Tax=Fusarium flagelliforme TaxID=2675880 RepID=UPI001E8D87A3|nr:uncharacterized protein B0J16DRAFT_327401 [Fusarium flagelliforme]KAH7197083.1 hypothetical protein B0J16DRAFT_327401 [Fusarium flagelliforme]
MYHVFLLYRSCPCFSISIFLNLASHVLACAVVLYYKSLPLASQYPASGPCCKAQDRSYPESRKRASYDSQSAPSSSVLASSKLISACPDAAAQKQSSN